MHTEVNKAMTIQFPAHREPMPLAMVETRLAKAIRSEIVSIVPTEHLHLIEKIMKAQGIDAIYRRIQSEDRMPTEDEWEMIRRTILSLYGGYISNDTKRKATQEYLLPLVNAFYSNIKNHSIRIGCFIGVLHNALDKAHTDIKDKFKEIILTTPRTLKKYCMSILPKAALKLGRNGQKDREAVQVFLKENLI